MKKSTIKRRKRVVPAMQEHMHSNQQHPSFASGNGSELPQYENGDGQTQQSPQVARDESMSAEGLTREQHMDQQRQYETPPIDFTGYQIERPRQFSAQSQQHSSPPNPHEQVFGSQSENHGRLSPFQSTHTRKRSYSNTDHDDSNASSYENGRANRLSSISSILNPTQRREDMPIDPSLSLLGQQALRQSQSAQRQTSQQAPPPPKDEDLRRHGNIDADEWRTQRKAKLRQEIDQMKEILHAKEREIEELDGEG